MKKSIITSAICTIFNLLLFAQNGEFTIYKNGLIYHDSTMVKLSSIVDSLNNKFTSCELNKVFYSKKQAQGHFVQLDSGNIRKAKKEIENGISFENFIKNYSNAKVDKNQFVVKSQYHSSYSGHVVRFTHYTLKDNSHGYFSYNKQPEMYSKPLAGKWIYKYSEKTSYSSESLRAWYFPKEFRSVKISNHYGSLIQYVDCLIDTNHTVQRSTAKSPSWEQEKKSKVRKYIDKVNSITSKPVYDHKSKDKSYSSRYKRWKTERFTVLDQKMKESLSLNNLFEEAIEEGIDKGTSNNDFEVYVSRYKSKDIALELKRQRIVYGQCSMDQSPRVHAKEIAKLSAETNNWEIFLRSHLNVMNDRFERMSDGSYAQGGRGTYIKELEELHINVVDLLLGSIFRIENANENHYYGDVSRIGRALAESQNLDQIENQILEAISDENLDSFNRIIFVFLFDNYQHWLKDSKRIKLNKKRLEQVIKTLPKYLTE